MFFSGKPHEELILILEVQSAMARGSLAYIRKGQSPHVVFTYLKNVPYKPGAGSAYLVKMTLRALTEIVSTLLEHHHAMASHGSLPKSISAVHYILSSPWMISQAKTVSVDFPKPTEITEEKVMEIIAAERAKLSVGPATQTEVVEEKIFDVSLNGYSVPSWQDKEARQLQVSFVVSVAGSNLTRRFRDVCAHAVRPAQVHFHSSLLLQNVGIQLLLPSHSSYVLVHIHGELTDVVVVEHHSCVFFGSYPEGVRTVIRKIARATKTDFEAADSLLTLHVGGSLDPAHQKSVGPIITEIARGWTSEFAKLFKVASFVRTLPSEAFIASRLHENLFIQSFKTAHPESRVQPLGIAELLQHVTFDRTAERFRIVGLYALAIDNLATQ